MASQEEFDSFEYSLFTNGIEVFVKPFYAEELSYPDMNKYVFIYKVRIKNFSKNKVKLISRNWHIIESDGTSYNVNGDGVVGKQPVLEVNEEFEYASQAVFFNNNGLMYGSYKFVDLENDSEIEAEIPAFSLDMRIG